MEVHETHEMIHESAHAHQSGGNAPHKVSRNRKIAVMISILAAALALIEAAGKSAQNDSISANIEASNLWAFFQAKTIRMTTMRTAADSFETLAAADPALGGHSGVAKQIADWRATAQRYDSEPDTGEGRKELASRAKAADARHQVSLSAYHLYEYGAAALQIAIVLCSAATVTDTIALAFAAGTLGAVGVGFALVAWLAPTLIHL